MAYRRAKNWSYQPPVGTRINWNNPLSRGLKLALPMNEGAGLYAYDAAAKSVGTFTGGLTWSSNKVGRAPYNANSSSQYLNVPFPWNGGPVTVSFWAVTFTDGAYSAFATEQGNDNYRFQVHLPFGGSIYWDYGNSSSGRLSTSYSAYINKLTHVCLVSNSTNFQAIYLNGIQVASQASAANPAPGTTIIVLAWPAAGLGFNGTVNNFCIWNRVLSNGEAMTLYNNPWGLYVPPRFNLRAQSPSVVTFKPRPVWWRRA